METRSVLQVGQSQLPAHDRLAALEAAAASVPSNMALGEEPVEVARVRAALLASRMLGAALLRVPPCYYSLPLVEHARLLACPVDRLCKTLVLENVALAGVECGPAAAPLGRQRYLAVLLQYTARLDVPALERALRAAHGGGSDLRLRAAEGAAALTGFPHNAVTPFGSATPLPLVVARPLAELPAPAYVWLGGGHVDVKLRCFVPQLLHVARATVLDVTVPRSDEHDEGD